MQGASRAAWTAAGRLAVMPTLKSWQLLCCSGGWRSDFECRECVHSTLPWLCPCGVRRAALTAATRTYATPHTCLTAVQLFAVVVFSAYSLGDGRPHLLLLSAPAAKRKTKKRRTRTCFRNTRIPSWKVHSIFVSKPEKMLLVICRAAATAAQLMLYTHRCVEGFDHHS